MKFLILLLCLKFIGVLSENITGVLSINQELMTDTYRYHDNLETFIMCGIIEDKLVDVTLKYIPQDGEPHTTNTIRCINTMYLKLTPANHNGVIECHIRGEDVNQTLTTKLENIEILQASGLYESKEVFRGFKVNGQLLNGVRENFGLPEIYQDFFYECFDKEILNIEILKGEDETASCLYFDNVFPIPYPPMFQPVHFNNNTFKYVFNGSSPGSLYIYLRCTVTDKNNRKNIYTLNFLNNMLYGYNSNKNISSLEEPATNNASQISFGSEGIVHCNVIHKNNEANMYELAPTKRIMLSSVPIVGLPRAEILLSYTTNDIDSVCISPQEKAKTQVDFLLKAARLVLLEYDGYTMTCTYDWCYDESQVECLESTEDNKTPKTCTFALKDGVKESIVKCAGAKDKSDYIKLIKKDQHVVA